MKHLRSILSITLLTLASLNCAADDYSALPYFESGPIRYGIKSENIVTRLGEAVAVLLTDKSVKSISVPYNVSRSKTNYSIEIIGPSAFANSALESVELSDGLKYIESSAFSGCPIKRLECPPKLRLIGEKAFSWCTELEEVVTDNNLKTVGDWAFRGCTKLRRFDCPPDMHTIGDGAFGSCSALEHITLGKDIINIGAGAFAACYNIKTITCNNTAPHTIDDTWANGVFATEVTNNALLIVPRGSLDIYKSTDGWKNFVHIIEQHATPGDVDNDEKVSTSDVVTIYNVIIGTACDDSIGYYADVNQDGEVNSADIVATYNIIVGGE
jgi:hypothetical protein